MKKPPLVIHDRNIIWNLEGSGYSDDVADERIREHLDEAIAEGDQHSAAFAAATLALRSEERKS